MSFLPSFRARKTAAGTAVDQCLFPGFWQEVGLPARPFTARLIVSAFNFCARWGLPFQVVGAGALVIATYLAGKFIGFVFKLAMLALLLLVSLWNNPSLLVWGVLGFMFYFLGPLIVLWLLSKLPGFSTIINKVIEISIFPLFKLSWSLTAGAIVETGRAVLGSTMSDPTQEILEGPWDPPTSADVTGDRRSYRGIARPDECPVLCSGKPGFRLGRYLSIRNGYAEPDRELTIPPDEVVHILVAAPAGAGKTRSVVLPFTVSALEVGWSTIVFDIKGDMLNALGGYPKWVSAKDGKPCRLLVWGPNVPLEHCAAYNPLEKVDEKDPKRLEAAVQAIMGAPQPGGKDDYWDKQYRLYLRLMIRVAKERLGPYACPYDLYRMANDREYFETLARGTSCARDLADHFARTNERYGEYMGGIVAAVQAFGDPRVQKRTMRSDFQFEDLEKERTMLVFTVPQSYKDLGATLLGLFFNAVDAFATQRVEQGAKGKREIMIVADEAPTMIKKVDLQNMVAVYRSGRIRVLIVAQEPAMLGEERVWKAIAGNCNIFVMLRGSQNSAIQYARECMGKRTEQSFDVTHSQQAGQVGGGESGGSKSAKVQVVEDRELKNPPTEFGMWTFALGLSAKPILTDSRNEFQELKVPDFDPAQMSPE